ncbi:GroES-like protein [Calocera viscosa TUFC12733]|uniref:GroES-like protein n=1 Tax=Calocera viscosa (strain TUFC12733) TaxID=1330018 RepID=A0A167QNE0_CALVF|nr:GroES-like protein [Calocera viscosa TUFC12733]
MSDNQLMRALIQVAYGRPAKSLVLKSVPKPVLNPSSSDLLVRVKAASIAPAEWGFLIGITRIAGVFSIPDGLGIDFAGVVEGVGEGAKAEGWTGGEEVMGCVPISLKGTYQEYVLVPSSCCARKPENISWEEAAALPANAMTALQALEKHQGGKEAIFVTGGLGGVGHLIIQLAHHRFGYKRIITSVSTSKVERFKELYPYVDEVIDYKKTNPTSVVPKASLDVVYSTLGTPGQWVPYLAPQRPVPTLIEITISSGAAALQENWGLTFPWYARWLFDFAAWWKRPRVPEGVQFVAHNTRMLHKDLQAVADEAAAGQLKPLIGRVFSLEEGTEAFELVHKGIVGKVVFRVSE